MHAWYEATENAITQFHLYGEQFYDPQNLATEMTRRHVAARFERM